MENAMEKVTSFVPFAPICPRWKEGVGKTVRIPVTGTNSLPAVLVGGYSDKLLFTV